MKQIIELERASTDITWMEKQFEGWNGEKTILFVNPQLSGKHLYKMLLPFGMMKDKKIKTAITNISRFNSRTQLMDVPLLTDKMIDWAQYIVLPFTTQPLVSDLYVRIRERNKGCKIVYSVDYNYYDVSPAHPFKNIFDEPTVINDIEDNIYFSDITFVSNAELQKTIATKFKHLAVNKYNSAPTNLAGIANFPIMLYADVMLENTEGFEEYKNQEPINITAETTPPDEMKKALSEISKVSEKIKIARPIIGKKKREAINKSLPPKKPSKKTTTVTAVPIQKNSIKKPQKPGKTNRRTTKKKKQQKK